MVVITSRTDQEKSQPAMPAEAPAITPIGTLSQRLRTLSQARETANGTIDHAVVKAIAAASPDGSSMLSAPRPETKALVASCTQTETSAKARLSSRGEQWVASLLGRGPSRRAKEIAGPPQQRLDKKGEDQAEQ